MSSLSKPATIGSWVAQLTAAGVLGMAGVMKWISTPDSIRLFEDLGVEPWGRYLMGTAELVATLLLLVPRTAMLGGAAAMALMAGAIGVHVFRIGIVYNGDASLFMMAMMAFIAGLVVWIIRRRERGTTR
jgi:uncharacterized membrane protein YphA (DoxX/SURF4 family)